MRIPKIIHQVWLGNKPMHPLMHEWREKWMFLHPGWRFCLWRDPSPTTLANDDDVLSSPVPELLTHACHHAQRANMWRYEILRLFGGVYVDTDVEPFKPICDLVENLEAFVVPRFGHQKTIYENAFLGAISGHPWMEELAANLSTRDPAVSLSMGVDYLTPVTKRHPEVTVLPEESVLFIAPDDWEQSRRDAEIPGATSDLPPAGCYARHHWSSLWYPTGFASIQ